jgi:WD40 repeat protein
MGPRHTRVAVVQIAYHPAILVDRRSPLEDPLFTLGAPDALSASGKELPEAFAPRLEALRRRIRETYDAQLLGRVEAILTACRGWRVEVVVFPEYSIPWEILGGVAEAGGEMVVVAGTHTVEPAARKSGVYERLALPREAMPALGQSVAPVLHRGRLIGLSAKLNASQHEPQMRAGSAWAPVEMPGGIPGPMGILVCLDFLYRESTAHRELVAEAMDRCRFLAVPSLTPAYTMPEFAGKAWEEARRYGRPVLYCDGADGGGTAIYADEGRPADLRSFPEHAGLLDAGDEGVIVADVDLGYERPGRSTRYSGSRPVVPVAAATLVYRANPTAEVYARWLGEAGALLARDDDGAVEALAEWVAAGRDVLLNAGALSGGAARGRRLSRLVREIEKVTSVEEIRLLTREVVVPAEVLPLPALRAGMAKGAADAVFAWMKERRGGGLEEVERRLREAGEAVKAGGAGDWTREGAGAIEGAALAVRGEIEEEATVEPVEVPVRVVLPKGIDPAALEERRHGRVRFRYAPRPEYFRSLYWREVEEVDDDGHTYGLFFAPQPELLRDPGAFSNEQVERASDLFLLAIAHHAQSVAVLGVWILPDAMGDLFVLSRQGDRWILSVADRSELGRDHNRERVLAALADDGIAAPTIEVESLESIRRRCAALGPRFYGARQAIQSLSEHHLREVKGKFVESEARVNGGERQPILGRLDDWLSSNEQTALLLGEFGSGKSTALAVWAERQWQRESGPRPILVNLAGAVPTMDAEGLLFEAAGAEDTPANRAAIRLLVRYRFAVPCFDGFDEIATRVGAADLAGRLAALLEIARGGPGQVLVSCRDNYFPTGAQLNTTTESALLQALGSSAGVRRIVLELFDEQQVEELVDKVCETPEATSTVLGRIAQIYDLKDLVKRPLLLGIVLTTLDRLDSAATVGTADLYEAYLRRWLDQTRSGDPECFSDEQKIDFAEALADQLWKSGQTSCTWRELQASVRARLAQRLPDDMPPAAAFLEIQGGAFFVHEGEDRYRFAHKSFLEYFLARGLVRTLPERPTDVLTTQPITPEVAAFVGEVLRGEGDPKQSQAVSAVRTWLKSGRSSPSDRAAAAANGLRLLVGLSRWAQEVHGWLPERADLRGVRLVGEDLSRIALAGADLSGANLSDAAFSEADLTAANLSGSNLRRADFTGAHLQGANLQGANLAPCGLAGANLEGAQFDGAKTLGARTASSVSELRGAMVVWSSPPAEGPLRIRWGAVSACGRWLAIPGPALAVTIWDLDGETVAQRLGSHDADVCALAWSPDGTHVLTGTQSGTLTQYETMSGRPVWRSVHGSNVYTVSYSGNGQVIVSSGDDNRENVSSLTFEREPKNTLRGAYISQRSRARGDDPLSACAVKTWNRSDGSMIRRLNEYRGDVFAASLNNDGNLLAMTTDGGGVELWDAALGRLIGVLGEHDGSLVFDISFCNNDAYVASSTDYDVKIWVTFSPGLVYHSADYHHLALPLAKRLRVSDNNARSWVSALEHQLRAALQRETDHCIDIIVDGESPRVVYNGPRSVDVWDIRGERWIHLPGENDRPSNISSVAASRDGTNVVAMADDGILWFWDVLAGRPCQRVRSAHHVQANISLSPDGMRVAVAGHPASVWDFRTGRHLANLEGRLRVTWSPDGSQLLTYGWDDSTDVADTICLSDALTGDLICTWGVANVGAGAGTRWSVLWAPDGARAIRYGGDLTVSVWNVVSRMRLFELHGLSGTHDGRSDFVWSPDGAYLACGDKDAAVRLWDATTGEPLRELRGHWGPVRSVAWGPSKERLLSGGADGTLRVWDTTTGAALYELRGHLDDVTTVAWAADGDRIISASQDNTVRIWSLSANRCTHILLHVGESWASIALDGPDGLPTFAGDGAALRLLRVSTGLCAYTVKEIEYLRSRSQRPVTLTAVVEAVRDLRTVLSDSPTVKAIRDVVEALPRSHAAEVLRDVQALSSTAVVELMNSAAFQLMNSAAFQLINSPVFQLARQRRALGKLPGATSEALAAEDGQPAAGPEVLDAPEAPTDMLNPFRPGPALADTAALPPGREPLIARLLDHLRRGLPTVLRGHRRSGKTSILRHLAHRLAPGAHYATLEGRRIKTAADLAHLLDASLKGDAAADLLRDQLHADPGAALLLDEIGHLCEAEPSVFAWIRAVGQDGTGVLLSGSPWDWTRIVRHAAQAPGSSFSNDVALIDLGPLEEADAIRFLVETAALAEVPIEPDKTARWIIDRCGAWPFYLQVMGDAVVGAVARGNRRALVEASGVSDLYEQSLFAAHDGSFQVRWEELPAAAQAIARTVRGPAKPIYRDLRREDQKILRDTGLCDARGQWIDDRPFFEWIQRTVARSTRPPPAASAPDTQENTMAPKLPKPLVEAYRKGKVALFVGSGLSQGSDVKGRFPAWRELPERLLAACSKYGARDDDWIERKRDNFQARMQLEEMLAELGVLRTALDRDYQAALHDIFDPAEAEPGAVHRAVAALGVPAVLTTNYDQLLEAVDPPPRRQRYTWKQADKALGLLRGGRKVLLKVHGSVEDHESIVMSDREYDRARRDASYQQVLGFLLQDSTFLFIGYGMNDPLDLDLALKANADAFRSSAQKHFVLLRNPSDGDADRYHREYHVEVIPYFEHAEVTAVLEALASARV